MVHASPTLNLTRGLLSHSPAHQPVHTQCGCSLSMVHWCSSRGRLVPPPKRSHHKIHPTLSDPTHPGSFHSVTPAPHPSLSVELACTHSTEPGALTAVICRFAHQNWSSWLPTRLFAVPYMPKQHAHTHTEDLPAVTGLQAKKVFDIFRCFVQEGGFCSRN